MLSVPFPSPAPNLYSDSMQCPWVGIVKILCQIASLPPPTLTLPPAMGVGGKMRLDTGDMHPLHCPDWRKKRARQATRLLILFILAVSCQVIWSPAVLLTTCVYCLFFIRHSPKVVKAASQVLNSMWQYRDLRSLYKKVRLALPSWLVSCTQTLSLKTIFGHKKMCHRYEGTLSESLSNWNRSETRESVKKPKKKKKGC